MQGTKEYSDMKRKVAFDLLDQFPDAPSNALAKILKRENPIIFKDKEEARSFIRRYRGKSGKGNRKNLSTKKYFQLT